MRQQSNSQHISYDMQLVNLPNIPLSQINIYIFKLIQNNIQVSLNKIIHECNHENLAKELPEYLYMQSFKLHAPTLYTQNNHYYY